jgi:hypothetical protein
MWSAIGKNAVSWVVGGIVHKDGKPISDGQYTFHFKLDPNKGTDDKIYSYSMSVDISDSVVKEAGEDYTKLLEWGIDFVVERFREAILDSYKEKETCK